MWVTPISVPVSYPRLLSGLPRHRARGGAQQHAKVGSGICGSCLLPGSHWTRRASPCGSRGMQRVGMVWGCMMRVPVNGLCLVFAAEVGRTGPARSPSTRGLWSDKWLTPTPRRVTRSSTPCRTGGAVRAGLTRCCQHLPQAGEQGCAGLLDLGNAFTGWGSQDLALSSHGPHQIFISTSLIWRWGITCACNGSDLELCLLMPVQQEPGDELVLAPPGPSGGRSRMLTGREQLPHPLLL